MFSKDEEGEGMLEELNDEKILLLYRMYSSRRDEVCVDAPAGEGDLQGDRRDDRDRGQEWGREDQLLRVQVISDNNLECDDIIVTG